MLGDHAACYAMATILASDKNSHIHSTLSFLIDGNTNFLRDETYCDCFYNAYNDYEEMHFV